MIEFSISAAPPQELPSAMSYWRPLSHLLFIKDVFEDLKSGLTSWLYKTKDPWICAPHAVFENKGRFKDNPRCMPLHNDLINDNNIVFKDDNLIL